MRSWETESVHQESLTHRAFSPVNIALSKYWGKRDIALNLPAMGSFSVTLDSIGTEVTVEFNPRFTEDRLLLNGKEEFGNERVRVTKLLNDIRQYASAEKSKLFARVQTKNNFPTGAGLASSASAFSAITYAATCALKLDLLLEKLSELSRKASGSSCRSFFGGYVLWEKGIRADGQDSIARQILPPDDLCASVAILNREKKDFSSSKAMEVCRETSPFYAAWVQFTEAGLPAFQKAALEQNFTELADLSERNCMMMHAVCQAAEPMIPYFSSETYRLCMGVRRIRERDGVPVFFTVDAGPNPVLFYRPEAKMHVQQLLLGVTSVVECRIGNGVRDL